MPKIERDWFHDNREYIISSIEHSKILLRKIIPNDKTSNQEYNNLVEATESKKWEHSSHLPALEVMAQIFNLSEFEKAILVLCTGAEIDSEVSALCSKIYGDPQIKFVTFDIALRTLPQPNWNAILPNSNLRRYRLISINSDDDVPLITRKIRVEERILHYILGFKYAIDSRLQYVVRDVRLTAPIPDSHINLIPKIVRCYSNLPSTHDFPIFHLWGPDRESQLIVAERACKEMDIGLWSIPADIIASKSFDEQLILPTILSRECFLAGKAIYIDGYDVEESVKRAVTLFVMHCSLPLMFFGTRDPWSLNSTKPSMTIHVKRPTKKDQQKIWHDCMKRYFQYDNSDQLNDEMRLENMVERYNLDAVSIENIAKNFSSLVNAKIGKTTMHDMQYFRDFLQDSTSQITNTRLGDLAEKIEPMATLEDIILPVSKKEMIKMISIHFKHRRKIYEDWGFSKKSNRGFGIVALFSGESGTGKTMAAEAVANELGADLYRIDLSMVASKYIGETEKNFRQIFDGAETRECVLFFDEADSLFGKRSEVRDSHDRYANMQVAYLLQRIESFDGIAILATNFKKNLDSAFLRRIRFIVDFPFPDEKNREEIWRRIFPKEIPKAPLDFKFLSRLSITGGNIRNIALNAAFLAAEDNKPVSMSHIHQAAEEEYVKIGRAMSSAEIGSWP